MTDRNARIAAALGLADGLAGTVYAHLLGLAELLGLPLAATRAELGDYPAAIDARVGDVVYAHNSGRQRLAYVVELVAGMPGRLVVAFAVPSARSIRTADVLAARCRLVRRAAELPSAVASTEDALTVCELGPIVRLTTADPAHCTRLATTTVRTTSDEARPACGRCAARYRSGCGVEQPLVPPAPDLPVGSVGVAAGVGHGVYCWRCWAGLGAREDGSHVAPGEQLDRCPSPAAAGGPHVPTTVARPADALDVAAPVGGGSALVSDDAYDAGMLPLAGGDGFLF